METENKEIAKTAILFAAICVICDIILTILGFVSGNVISGMGWMCALFANLEIICFAIEKYNE